MTDPIEVTPHSALEIANRESFIVGPEYSCIAREAANAYVELRCTLLATEHHVERSQSAFLSRACDVPEFCQRCRSAWANLKQAHVVDKAVGAA